MTSLELVAFGIGNFGTGSGLLLRRQTLCPTELRAHIKLNICAKTKITYRNIRRKTILFFLFKEQSAHFFLLVFREPKAYCQIMREILIVFFNTLIRRFKVFYTRFY